MSWQSLERQTLHWKPLKWVLYNGFYLFCIFVFNLAIKIMHTDDRYHPPYGFSRHLLHAQLSYRIVCRHWYIRGIAFYILDKIVTRNRSQKSNSKMKITGAELLFVVVSTDSVFTRCYSPYLHPLSLSLSLRHLSIFGEENIK